MKGRGTVRGILIEGGDGYKYLLGFESTGSTRSPTLSRRQADGTFERLADMQEAAKAAIAQIGITGQHLIGPGWGKEMFLWTAFKEALKAFPPVPTWPPDYMGGSGRPPSPPTLGAPRGTRGAPRHRAWAPLSS